MTTSAKEFKIKVSGRKVFVNGELLGTISGQRHYDKGAYDRADFKFWPVGQEFGSSLYQFHYLAEVKEYFRGIGLWELGYITNLEQFECCTLHMIKNGHGGQVAGSDKTIQEVEEMIAKMEACGEDGLYMEMALEVRQMNKDNRQSWLDDQEWLAQRREEHQAEIDAHNTAIQTEQQQEEETAEQVEDVATYTSTTYRQEGEVLACVTTTLPTETFEELTSQEIQGAMKHLMTSNNWIKVEITRWTAQGGDTIAYTLPGSDSAYVRMTQPTIPDPPKPAHYGEEFREPSGTGPVITVGHPHPHTGLIVQWPSDMSEGYQEDCFINLLNSCPMEDIQPLMKEIDSLVEGDRIAFTWNKRDYKADFKLVRHSWYGGLINVKNATHTYGKVLKYQNNIRIQTMTNFRIIK